jgi:hypothetical protein
MAATRAPPRSESELVAMLRVRYEQDHGNGVSGCVIAQVRDDAGFSARRSLDAVAMGFWPSRGLLIEGFECKSSRSDWQRELKDPSKAEQFLPMLDRFWIVAGGAGIVDEHELPPGWGLLIARGRGLVQVRAAAALRDLTPGIVDGRRVLSLPPGFSRGFLVGLLRNGTARARVTPEEIEAAKTKAFADGQEHGEQLAGDYRQLYDDLRDQVAGFQEESGIDIGRYGRVGKDPRAVGAAVKAVLLGERDAERLEQRLRRVAEDAEHVAEQARARLAEYGTAA